MRAKPKSQIFKSQFSFTRMLLGFKSRCTTPAEWTYFKPRCQESAGYRNRNPCATYQNLVKEILDELLLQRSGGKQAVKICSEQLGDEVAESVSGCLGEGGRRGLHVLQGRDEDVAQADDLRCCQD